jgi:hypothetical protein
MTAVNPVLLHPANWLQSSALASIASAANHGNFDRQLATDRVPPSDSERSRGNSQTAA